MARVTAVDLAVSGRAGDIDAERFEAAAREADERRPISIALRDNVGIRLSATLE